MLRKIETALSLVNQQGIAYTFGYATYLVKSRLVKGRVASGVSYKSLGGVKFFLHPSMKGLSETVFLYSVHEPENTRLYSELVRPGDVVIDIGGNIGYYAVLAARHAGSNGRVIALEPVPDTYKYLLANVKDTANITTFPIAVGSEGAHAQLHISAVPNWSALYSYPGQHVIETLDVQTRSVDSLVAELSVSPDVLRMDIEGGEVDAIAGAQATLARCKPRICMELHPTILGVARVASVVAMLKDHGYEDGIVMDRVYDEPYMPAFVRSRHVRKVKLADLIANAATQLHRTTHLITLHPDNA